MAQWPLVLLPIVGPPLSPEGFDSTATWRVLLEPSTLESHQSKGHSLARRLRHQPHEHPSDMNSMNRCQTLGGSGS
jgi:hypothetical protein